MGRAFSRSLRVCAVREVRNQVRMVESLAVGRLVLGACGGALGGMGVMEVGWGGGLAIVEERGEVGDGFAIRNRLSLEKRICGESVKGKEDLAKRGRLIRGADDTLLLFANY